MQGVSTWTHFWQNETHYKTFIRLFLRSTKSEKLYPSMLQRSEEVESNYYTLNNHCSQPTSPTPVYHHMSGSSNRYTTQSLILFLLWNLDISLNNNNNLD
jgi:hypothetical protein